MRLLKLVPDDTNVSFIRWRTVAMAISFLTIIASIALVATRGLNYGVDFAGGQSIRMTFPTAPSIDQLRGDLAGGGNGDASIQSFGGPNQVQIRTRLPADADEATANRLSEQTIARVRQTFPAAQVDSVDTVSGKVSVELLRTGVLSLGLAMIAIAIYIWLRFEWQFGVGALFALFHDVMLTFGFFALTQLEFNLNIVAALLTIIGYSLNDTIVVYDRIRENLKKYRKMAMLPLLDLSLNETLARTVMTSLTMIIALSALLIWGPEVIFGFAAAMLLGIFIGTYSSIYMAAPILVWLKVGPDSFVPRDSGPKGAERVTSDGARV